MTPEERAILQPFLEDLGQSRGAAKDPEAAAMIDQAVRNNPDAVYLLVQHAILADQALHAAQAQIQDLQSRLEQPVSQGPVSFLGGGGPPTLAGPYEPAEVQDAYPAYGAQPSQPVQSNPMSANSGLGGFLRSAGTMAAGVAAGDFLAQGLSNIFGGGRDW